MPTLDKSQAWLEYAKEHPADWHDYQGGCNCAWCADYRRRFEEWYKRLQEDRIPLASDDSAGVE